ncbi:DUF6252 family protein [Flavobacterium sp.]|uniref:DUF6252 family protein n=1 Tax=Flavobacterium sp. TaxID=239 RepID=UPI0026161DC8|nr:DUF6252 family protein [Flavobacterium sp.]MDD3003653.1 DUF6252 family protein [Flavobacterium sp.]
MKTYIKYLFVFLAITACNNDDNKKTTNPIDQLPPATQTGANTAGCLVNGVAFLPKGYFPGGNLVCNYIDGKDFILSIGERIMQGSSDIMRDVSFGSQNQNLHDNVGVTYLLGENNFDGNSKYGNYIIYNNTNSSEINYETNSIVTGEFKITYHNYNSAILSGTFWFDAVNANGEKVEVREGRFDIHY